MSYYAHSAKQGRPRQDYAAHIQGVVSLFRQFMEEMAHYCVFDSELLQKTGTQAAFLHDIGKLLKQNQEVLSGEKFSRNLPVNHVDAGVAACLIEQKLSVLAAAVIRAHHAGYPDFTMEANRGELVFRDEEIGEFIDNELPSLERIHNSLVHEELVPGEDPIQGDQTVFLRMLLSCLADADHSDTARNYGNYPEETHQIPLQPELRLKLLDDYVSSLNNTEGARGLLRDEMYSSCRAAEPGGRIVSCDSPVGSGKTTAVMAHLLAQAGKLGLRRIIVVLPFTNIITQSVEIYRKALVLPGEDPKEVVAEIHHLADFESDEAKHLTALWRAPIIVTTAVSFFETLASNTPSTLRRLHELPGAAVFLDESHAALPAKLLPLAWRWITIYAKEWGCYWILASGSLTEFWKIPEIAREHINFAVPAVMNDDLRTRLAVFEQRRITYRDDLQPKGLAEIDLMVEQAQGPRLVILNTIQSAAVVAQYICEQHGREKVEHLSTALTPIDRERTLAKVKTRLANPTDHDWTLVATSCVEAGVNLDFCTGFRELSSLVSLLQAAGRVNREGKYPQSQVWTFRIAEGDFLQLNPSLDEAGRVLKYFFDNGVQIDPSLSTQSIQDEIRLYGLNSIHKKLYQYESESDFPSVQANFHVIEANNVIVVIDPAMQDRLRIAGFVNWQELQKSSVQIAQYKVKYLGLPSLIDRIYGWNLMYDDFLGYMSGYLQFLKSKKGTLIAE